MPASEAVTARALLAHRPFLFYLCGRSFSGFAYNIATVAVGWQIYELTGSAFDLGMVGLVQFLPNAFLIFAGGHVADSYDRNRILQVCQLVEAVAALYLGWATYTGFVTVPQIFAVLAVLGIAKAFENPAAAALLPGVAPEGTMQRAAALSSGSNQLSMIAGPALGGIAYGLAPSLPYWTMLVFLIIACAANGAIKLVRPVTPRETPDLSTLFAGVAFVRRNPAIFGTISLDLFAVLLGGATALLPIYAKDILETGPFGLGVLRAAPAIGALMMTVMLTRYPIGHRVGMRMFQAVIAFGIATLIFALSQWMWLSILALLAMGAADMVSVVIRVSLVQLATPDDMRGRVGAVNFLFINASNQLGQFESGLTAALFGTVPAAALGGIGTILVALLWMKLFPTLRDVDRLE
jgi:MFS family permease